LVKYWIIHHDNAPSHKELSIKKLQSQKSITEKEHPPCSPDLAPNYFWLFPKINYALKGRRFQDTEDIHKNVTKVLKIIPQQEFQKYFQQWQHRLAKFIAAQGEYFGSDSSQQL
jgi:transposase